MKIYKLANPLPLEEIPIERGGQMVDYELTEDDVIEIEGRFDIVETLGEGQFGIAYLTKDGKVLKLTTDLQEIEAAKEIKQFRHGPFAEIYETGNIKENLFYILKEKVQILSEQEQNLMQQIMEAVYIGESIDIIEGDEELKQKMEDYIIEAQNYMQFSDTFNLGNIGKDRYGNIVCFDTRLNQ